eukprot:5478481-Prymnesium_polylepis.1
MPSRRLALLLAVAPLASPAFAAAAAAPCSPKRLLESREQLDLAVPRWHSNSRFPLRTLHR